MRRTIIPLLAALLAAPAFAGGPHFSPTGGVASATSVLSGSEYTGGTFSIDGSQGKGTFGGGVNIAAPAPTSPTNGDCWITTAGLNCRVSGATVLYGSGTGNGTVTSVGLAPPSIFSAGSPVTTSGSVSFSLNSQAPGQVFASPSASSGVPTFRALAAADIPTLNQNTTGTAANVTGIVAAANGGTGVASAPANQVLATPNGSSGAFGSRALAGADIPPINLAGPGLAGGTYNTLPVGSGGTGSSLAGGAQLNLQYYRMGSPSGFLARTLQNKFDDVVSVLDFAGVDPTGASDSLAGIQNAQTAICAKGGTLYFPAGTYALSNVLNVSCSNLTLAGAGIGNTVIRLTNATSGAFNFTGAQNQGIRDLTITAGVTQAAGAFISTATSNTFVAENLGLNAAFQGVLDQVGSIHWYDRIHVTNIAASTGVGFYQTGQSADVYLDHWDMDAPNAAQPFACIRLNNSGGTWITNSDLIHCGYGMLVDPQTSSDYVNWVFVQDTAFDTNKFDGIRIAPVASGSYATGLFFNGVWSSTNQYNGVSVTGGGAVSNINMNFMHILNNFQEGLDVDAAGPRSQINLTNSQVSGNSLGSSGAYAAVHYAAGVSSFSILNNLIGQTSNFANTQNQPIAIDAGASNHYNISNNDVRNNNNGLSDKGTGTDKYVSHNLGYNPVGISAISVGATPFSWTNNTGDTVLVYVNGGTVTNVNINSRGVQNPAAGTSMGYTIPQGGVIAVTYSSAPTMAWGGY